MYSANTSLVVRIHKEKKITLLIQRPRLFRQGNAIEFLNKYNLVKFQWSHVFSDMEIGISLYRVPWVYDGFNGATSFQKWIVG